MKWLAIFFALVALAAGAWYVIQPMTELVPENVVSEAALPDDATVAVIIPSVFSKQEQAGKHAYDAVCAACHGMNGQGRQEIAPHLHLFGGDGPDLVGKVELCPLCVADFAGALGEHG